MTNFWPNHHRISLNQSVLRFHYSSLKRPSMTIIILLLLPSYNVIPIMQLCKKTSIYEDKCVCFCKNFIGKRYNRNLEYECIGTCRYWCELQVQITECEFNMCFNKFVRCVEHVCTLLLLWLCKCFCQVIWKGSRKLGTGWIRNQVLVNETLCVTELLVILHGYGWHWSTIRFFMVGTI